jgi:hypothetical protein
MAIWLKGTGRTNEELARVLMESNGGKDTNFRHRRSHDRHALNDGHGELIYKDSRTPCQVLEISSEGCSLQTEKPFHPGALAPVEVVMPILGMILHIAGVTQWVKKDRQLGVHFSHVNSGSVHQLECLIACLLGRSTAEFLRESVASPVLNLHLGDVLALQAPKPKGAKAEAPATRHAEELYDRQVHGGEARLHTLKEGEWKVTVRAPDERIGLNGSFADISLGGCTIRTVRPFCGEVRDPVELDFEVSGVYFLMNGVAQVVYDPHCIGIRFNPMTPHQKEELALRLVKLCAARRCQIEAA